MFNFSIFSKWFYRGEGNKTLVISNPESRKVLRLQKSPVIFADRANSTGDTSPKRSDVLRLEFEKSIKLCKQIFVPLLGEKYVQPGVIVELPQEFMRKIKDLVTSDNKERPKFRLGKEVDIGSKFGVVMPDFCFVSGDGLYANEVKRTPTFCVEIKPKCGTIPACAEVETGTYKKVKESICKYCLLQWTKVNEEGKYLQRSGYCPLDLFSADIKRVWHALLCLLKNPQNNLRIFKDGKVVYAEETKAPSFGDGHLDNGGSKDNIPADMVTSKQFSHLLHLEQVLGNSFATSRAHQLTTLMPLYGDIDGTNLPSINMFLATLLQLLIHDSHESVMNNHQHSSEHLICEGSLYNDTSANLLTRIPTCFMSKGLAFGKGGVLRKILDVQKLNKIGTDKAFSIFNEFCASGQKDGIDSHIFTFNENIAKCNINSKNKETNTNCNVNILDTCSADKGLSTGSELDDLRNFLIAASANDCSIMISFQEVSQESHIPTNCSYFQDAWTDVVYKYEIAVVDLDQKESDRIPKYHREYHRIVDNYVHFNLDIN